MLSVTDWKIVGTPHFVGGRNYARLLRDPLFHTALKNTVVYTAVIVPVMALVGLGLALLLNQPLRGRVVTRTAVFASYVVMVSVVGITWRWMFDPTGAGIVNYYLGQLGVAPLPWVAAPETAMLSIIIATIWWTAGYNMILYLAGLQDIPVAVREAARIDGATGWQEFRHVTLPMLRPVTFFVVVMSIAKSFQVFGQVYVMTQGGPSNSTLTIVNYLYVVGFTWFEMGYAAAIAYALFALLLVITVIQFRMTARRERRRVRPGGSGGAPGPLPADGPRPRPLGGAPGLDALHLAQARGADPQPGAALDSPGLHAGELSRRAGQVPAGRLGCEQHRGGGRGDASWDWWSAFRRPTPSPRCASGGSSGSSC